MRKSIFISAVAILFICIESHAQSMTYNHDASKQGQIQVMELGAGNLTPELYYTVTHRRYKNGAKAATSVKNTLRIAACAAQLSRIVLIELLIYSQHILIMVFYVPFSSTLCKRPRGNSKLLRRVHSQMTSPTR